MPPYKQVSQKNYKLIHSQAPWIKVFFFGVFPPLPVTPKKEAKKRFFYLGAVNKTWQMGKTTFPKKNSG